MLFCHGSSGVRGQLSPGNAGFRHSVEVRAETNKVRSRAITREELEMRATPLVCCLAFLAAASSLQAADPFVGTWKMNVANSKPAPAQPGMAVKEETLIVRETGEHF